MSRELVADLGIGNVRIDRQVASPILTSGTEYGPVEGYPSLREMIAFREGVSIDEVSLTTGASMGLVATLATLERPSSILCPRPYYPAYPKVANFLGLDVIYYDLDKTQDWLPNPQQINHLVRSDTRAILWNFPSNPTGSIPTFTLLKEIATTVQRNNILIISDEVYASFVYDDRVFIDISEVFGHTSVVKLRSFSKLFGMPGERLGYVIAKPDRLQSICRAHWALAMSPPASAQVIALMTLRSEPNQIVRNLQQQLVENRSLAVHILKDCNRSQCYMPPAGIFCWIEVKDISIDSITLAHACKTQAGVVVVPGAAFGISSPNYLRASFALPKDEMIRGFEALTSFLEDI